jgi:hypothetical protein
MARVDAMLERLPQLYRDGELVRGVAQVPGLQLEIVDEEAIEVQRAHWFRSTLELEEAGRLAALLDIAPEPWQTLGTFRAWVNAMRDAWLRFGTVTRAGVQKFVEGYTAGYEEATQTTVVGRIRKWLDQPSTSAPAFVENPARRRYARAPAVGGIEPLQQFSVEQKGLDEAYAGFLLVGLPAGPESVPVIANLTTGQALIFFGNVPPGARLWIRPALPDEGTASVGVTARLEDRDVSERLRSVSGLRPGAAWGHDDLRPRLGEATPPAEAIRLARGRNDLWFLPVGHFNELGLDRFLFALPDLILRQGRYSHSDGGAPAPHSRFDQALFYQDPAVVLRMSWLETEPASFEVHLPGGTLLYPARPGGGALEEALRERDLLLSSLGDGVRRLKGAGVRANVQMPPFSELQPQLDLLTNVLPIRHREVGTTGADVLPDSGGLFEVTGFDESIFR